MSKSALAADQIIGILRDLENYLKGDPQSLECDLDVKDGDWGGKHMLVKLSPWSAAHIARLLVQLIQRDFNGAHFDIDKASVALETNHQLSFSLLYPGDQSIEDAD